MQQCVVTVAAAKGTELPNACLGCQRGIAEIDNKEEEFPAADVELLDMKLETAVLRNAINRLRALDPLQVKHQDPHNEWDALCVSGRNCPNQANGGG